MIKKRVLSKIVDGKRTCTTCGEAKPLTLYPHSTSPTCSICTRNATMPAAVLAAFPESAEHVPESLDSGPVTQFPRTELDASNPSIQELAARTLARRSLLAFIKRFKPKYMAGWVHEDICRRLERFMRDVEARREPRLLLMMPVRHGKSEIASRHFTPFVLGHHPDWEVIAASGALNLATSFSRYIRDLLRSDNYKSLFPGTQLDAASQSVENWNTTHAGGYIAAGIGTMITGRGAHILLIDDPVKDAEAADSQLIREGVWEWYISTALSRLAPGGGVLGILCMTGDTPVLLPDGTERRLDAMRVGDAVATFENGHLATSVVRGFRSSGRDQTLAITTSSGKVVRANGRHPFLIAANGELKWVRARSLSTAMKIVTRRGSGGSGEALPVLLKGVKNKLRAVDSAIRTTPRSGGPTGIVPRLTALCRDVMLNLSTGMASLLQTMTRCLKLSTACAPSVRSLPPLSPTSTESIFPSITATTQGRCEDYCAIAATATSDVLELSPWHLPQQNTCDFTLERIVSIAPGGVEEVFDLQIEKTENFIANGVVSHNTWWNEDDWAGRIQLLSAMEEGGDKFEIVKYPAVNDVGDEYILVDGVRDEIVQIPQGAPVPENARLTRVMGTALHEERYTLDMLIKRMKTYFALGQQRWWYALYQQNPVPEDGSYFTKEMFRFATSEPHITERHEYQTWDFAITEKAKNDWTVGVNGLQDTRDDLYVTDVLRFKSDDSFIIVDAILDFWCAHGKRATLGFEDGNQWKATAAVFARRCQERQLYPAFEVLTPFTDKYVRAQPLKGRMQAHKVWFNNKAHWWEVTRKELIGFGAGGKHEDIIDALAWLVRLTLMKQAPQKKKEKSMGSWRDKLPGIARGDAGTTHMSA